jgi:hypothetical protein
MTDLTKPGVRGSGFGHVGGIQRPPELVQPAIASEWMVPADPPSPPEPPTGMPHAPQTINRL